MILNLKKKKSYNFGKKNLEGKKMVAVFVTQKNIDFVVPPNVSFGL